MRALKPRPADGNKLQAGRSCLRVASRRFHERPVQSRSPAKLCQPGLNCRRDRLLDWACHAAGNAARGRTLYKGCADCHAINENAVGPMHKGVVGAKAGSVPGYDYSPDLKNSGIVWTEDNLDEMASRPAGHGAGNQDVLRRG